VGKRFTLYQDDDSVRGYYRELVPHCFHLLWLQYAKSWDSGAETEYWLELSEVDLDGATDEQMKEVAQYCGSDASEWQRDSVYVAHEFASYGLKAPLLNLSGNNAGALLKEGRRHSYELDDPEKHEEAMQKPVNQLGSTAREYFQGGHTFHFAMIRGISKNDTGAKIMAKMYGASDEEIEKVVGAPVPPPVNGCHAQIDMRGISRAGQADDPIAFSSGYMTALAGRGLPLNRKELVDAFIEGYRFGVDVRAGRLVKPSWHK
jgi:hypothetical protein